MQTYSVFAPYSEFIRAYTYTVYCGCVTIFYHNSTLFLRLQEQRDSEIKK